MSTPVKPIVMLPCPFCGREEVEIVQCEEGCCGAKPRWIQCECGCELGGTWSDDCEAVAAWNSRPDAMPSWTEEAIAMIKERAASVV